MIISVSDPFFVKSDRLLGSPAAKMGPKTVMQGIVGHHPSPTHHRLVWRVIWPGERRDQFGRTAEPALHFHFHFRGRYRRTVVGQHRGYRQDGIVMAVPAPRDQF